MLLIAAALTIVSGQPSDGWVWSYYDSSGMAVLAREVPDTERLSAVLECEPGSGVARITVYGPSASTRSASAEAGPADTFTKAGRASGP